jgi:hypothetical protein
LNVESLVSGQKLSRMSWLSMMGSFSSECMGVSASFRSSFSNKVTERICRRVCSEAVR